MNSLQRVLTTISHKEPDRVPIGEWGIDHDHVTRTLKRHTYWRNRKDSTIAIWEGRRDEMVQSMKHDYAELIEKLEYDIIPVSIVPPKGFIHPDPPQKKGQGLWEDSKGNIYKYSESNDSIVSMFNAPAKDDLTNEEIDKKIQSMPDFNNGEFELIDYICERYGKTKAIVYRGIALHSLATSIFGGDQTHRLMLPLLNPAAILRAAGYALAYAKKIIDKCKNKDIAIVMNDSDFGNNISCIESPETIRKLYMPVTRRFTEYVEQNSQIPFLHCCGNVWEIMNDLINAGYKGYQSIQASAGMDWAKVKKQYGDRLTLWTGIQCETLIGGSRREVEQEVKKALNTLKPGGGFIFGSTNSVQYGADTDNYLRALDLVREYGSY